MPQPRSRATRTAWPTLTRSTRIHSVTSPSPGIAVIDDFLDPATLTRLVNHCQQLSLTAPSLPKKGEATRTNERFQLDDPDFAHELWTATRLDLACSRDPQLATGKNGRTPTRLNSNIRVYTYNPGSFFGPHYDDDVFDAETGETSEWTLLVYLTGREDGVVGGETAFYPRPSKKSNGPAVVPELRAGRALLHRHGQFCALHEGRVVEKGVKWVLRSDVMYK
ncbi:hypothetical protein JCM10212_006971 [Sporobolomyces blumeae]